jgi:hypothetical protein
MRPGLDFLFLSDKNVPAARDGEVALTDNVARRLFGVVARDGGIFKIGFDTVFRIHAPS